MSQKRSLHIVTELCLASNFQKGGKIINKSQFMILIQETHENTILTEIVT